MADYGGPISTTPGNTLQSKIELIISCTHLPKLDTLSKSDPMVILEMKDQHGVPYEAGRTELIKNNHDPKFTKGIEIQYFFEEVQYLKFVIVDVDSPYRKITEFSSGKDLIGIVETTVGEIMGSRGSTLEVDIVNKEHTGRKKGKLRVAGFDIGGSNASVKFKLSATHLDKKDFLGKSDPYVVIHRGDESGTNFAQVHKTEYLKQTLDPVWAEFTIPMGLLCGNNPNLPLMFECWDWDRDGGHDLIGIFKTTLNELKTKKEYELIEPKLQKKKKNYTNSGKLQIREIGEVRVPSFLDYVIGGTEISIIFGIDFTGSNGDPTSPSSLHYRNPSGYPNEYMQAIRTVGDVVAPYDNDRMFPAYGFGGFLSNRTPQYTSHCFSITGDDTKPFCNGIDGVLGMYSECFSFVSLSGPTNFAPIITVINDTARQNMSGEKYTILLIITDGEITDMNQTVAAIHKSADLPVSIIIVGVGNADFKNMNSLDDDDGKLGFKRDCVQFVPFRDYKNVPIAKLAKDTLIEVPKQLVTYMTQHNILPRVRQEFISPPTSPMVNPVANSPPPIQQ